jgi:hypothetical protein
VETFLNAFWLALAIAATAIWWFCSARRLRQSGFRGELRLQAIALGTALFLLFPVISLTDDLHPEVLAVDAANGKRHACTLSSSDLRAHSTPARHSVPWSISPSLVSSLAPAFPFEAINVKCFVVRESAERRSRAGRAPPQSIL